MSAMLMAGIGAIGMMKTLEQFADFLEGKPIDQDNGISVGYSAPRECGCCVGAWAARFFDLPYTDEHGKVLHDPYGCEVYVWQKGESALKALTLDEYTAERLLGSIVGVEPFGRKKWQMPPPDAIRKWARQLDMCGLLKGNDDGTA